MSGKEQDWDKNTDEIRSIDSEELHETRPNRWTGPGSTWRKLTADDRAVYSALENLRNRDLSLHLYNAFALKHKGHRGGPGEEDVDKTTGELARQDEVWGPDKLWTAWPMELERVPKTEYMKREDDEDEAGDGRTFRRPRSREGFGAELEEEVAALMLRMAKEKFRSRRLGEGDEAGEEEGSRATTGGEESDVSLSQIKEEARSDTENNEEKQGDETDAPSGTRRERQRMELAGLVPTVPAEDDLSYELLQPLSRHLMTKLDKTLTVLHNARVAGIDYGSSSDKEQEETVEIRTARKPPQKKIWRGEESPPPEKPSSRRLDLHTPLEGETEREMGARLARKYHRRRPRFSDEEGDTTAAETAGSRPSRKLKQKRRLRSLSKELSRKPGTDIYRGKRLGDWALRDWSDVLGAAALAGFSPGVIARATQRCADLFGQGMEFNTITEEPATSRKGKSRTTRYVPGEPMLPATDEEEDEEAAYQSEVEQIRAVSRTSSVILGGSSDEDVSAGPEAPRLRSRSRSTSRGRSMTRRTYSVGPPVVRLFCPHLTCSGAISGFSRRYNLKTHLITVHGKAADALSEDDNEMDEVHGAVHVDGFLKPIRPRQGWRGGDAQPSLRRKSRRKTRRGTPPPRNFYSDDGYRAEYTDDDGTKAEDE